MATEMDSWPKDAIYIIKTRPASFNFLYKTAISISWITPAQLIDRGLALVYHTVLCYYRPAFVQGLERWFVECMHAAVTINVIV